MPARISDVWTDPRGQQRAYLTEGGGGLRASARQALERERVWSEADPSYDEEGYNVGPNGNIRKNDGVPWLEMAGVLAAPIAAAYLPGAVAHMGHAAPAAGGSKVATGGIWNTIGKFANNPLVQQGVSTAGNYLTARTNANAQRDASEAQLQGIREALDFEKSVYADDQKFFEPYGAAGQQSIARLSDLVAQPPRAAMTAQSVMNSGAAPMPQRRSRVSDLARY